MRASRRGQGLSVNMLIIIGIGLVVLVISILMYTRSTGKANDTLNSCGLSGICVANQSKQSCNELGRGQGLGSCPTGQFCCQMNDDDIAKAKALSEKKP